MIFTHGWALRVRSRGDLMKGDCHHERHRFDITSFSPTSYIARGAAGDRAIGLLCGLQQRRRQRRRRISTSGRISTSRRRRSQYCQSVCLCGLHTGQRDLGLPLQGRWESGRLQTPSPATGTDPNFIIVHPNQKWLYTADNVADVTSRFILNADGTLGARTTTATGNGAQGIGITQFP